MPLVVLFALAGCNTGPLAIDNAPPVVAMPAPNGPPRIAVLLPLSGANGGLGNSMLNAIRLAASHGTAPLDVRDTALPAGAAGAATQALQAHDDIILGPLTAADTHAAATVAVPAGVPILALTSDLNEARPGVWVLGITPGQQVARLVQAVRAEGRSRFAAFLPENALGDAMAAALATEASGADIRRHDMSFGSINDGMKALSAFDSRHGERDAQIKSDRASTDPVVKAQADALAAEPVAPLPFDSLLLADTGTQLQEVLDLLHPYDIQQSQVRVLGPALWGAFARKLGQIAGAWYAAPDPASRAGFVAAFSARYNTSPARIDDLAYDVGALATALAGTGGFSTEALTRPDGFAGTDGVFALDPNGHVRRGLAVFQVDQGGGARVVSPAPTKLSGAAQNGA